MKSASLIGAALACGLLVRTAPAAAPAAAAPSDVARAEGANLRMEIDARLATRLFGRFGGGETLIGDWHASDTVILRGGQELTDFAASGAVTTEKRNDELGAGTAVKRAGRAKVEGAADTFLIKELAVTTYEAFPGAAFVAVAYRNAGKSPITINLWRHQRAIAAQGKVAPAFWSYQPGSYESRPDWLRPLKPGFAQKNFLGMNASDYGGGTPIVDVWRRDVGVAVALLEARPRLVSLPVVMKDAGQAVLGVEEEVNRTLAPGERWAAPRVLVAVHRGDHFAALALYRQLMARQGIAAPYSPLAAYDPIWCGWGYERGVTLEQMRGTLGKAASLGFKWAVLDDGWQTGIGDWEPSPEKFPGGESEMKALTAEMRVAGLRPMLWWTPLAAHPKSTFALGHPDFRLLDRAGKPQKISWWDAELLCPAYAPVREDVRRLVATFVRDWGYQGLKLDGQHLNAVPPCYNPAHNHRDPTDSVTALPEIFKLITETARANQPSAVVELCPCGTSYSFHSLPYAHLPAASDPANSWQVRQKGKTLKALLGPQAAFFGDHVELSDGGNDFASTIGVGGVVGSQFTLPHLGKSNRRYHLTRAKERHWRKWLGIYLRQSLAQAEYAGELYDIGFDRPEAHAIRSGPRMSYAFFAKSFRGPVELRGLGPGNYRIRDYETGKAYGRVTGPVARLKVAFRKHLLLEATPDSGP